MNVLILGGTGFVGRNIAQALQKGQVPFLSISRTTCVDLRDREATQSVFREHRPDIIVNCAAHVGSLHYVTAQAAQVVCDNAHMILSFYQAIAAETPEALVINPIANCAYPATANTFEEDHWQDGPLHRSVLSYGTTRRLLWSVGECFQMQHGIRSITLFVPNMYGPYDSIDPNKAHALNALTAKFVKAKRMKQDEVVIWGTGSAVREWLFAPDFARLVLLTIKNPNRLGLAEPLNIGQHFGISVRELVGIIAKATAYHGHIRYDDSMPDGAPRKVMDDRRFRRIFPTFEFTPLEEGLREAVRYYESMGAF